MASIFVGDLASDVTEADLYTKFSQLGLVSSVKLCRDKESGQSLGYGYVVFHDVDGAEKAVETFNFDLTSSHNIRVVKVGKVNLCQAVQGNVFVKNLDRSIDSNMLYSAFCSFGTIITCKVPHGKKGSKCHGFVQFQTEAAACSAIASMNGTIFYGKKIYVGHCVNRIQREPTTETNLTSGCSSSSMRTVYIKNLGPTVDSVFLKITCCPYGEVSNVKIIRDTDGSSKGFAFVTFKKVEEANKAIEMLNGKEVDGRVIFAGAAMKKAGRKQQQQQQCQQQHGLQEITIEDSIIVEQHQNSKKHQQQGKLKQQLLQPAIETKHAQLLPAMFIKRQQQQQSQQQRWPQTFLQTSPCTVHLPNIASCPGQSCEINKLLHLPQIHQQIRTLQQQLNQQNSLEQQQQQLKKQPDQQQQQQQPQIQEPAVCQSQSEKDKQWSQEQQACTQSPQAREQQLPQGYGAVPSVTPQGVNLYVKHLDDDVNDTILKDMFSKFGEVISAKVMMEGEKSRGFGFVCFARAEDAARATRDMRRRVDDVNRKPLYVAPAQRKEERQAFFREKLMSRQADVHSGDVDQKQVLPSETTKEQQELNEHNQQELNLPGGDSSNTLGKVKLPQNKGSQETDPQTKVAKISLSHGSSIIPDSGGYHCVNLANVVRTLPKRCSQNLFNFEFFNLDNIRTPFIKPTRLTDYVGELTICPVDQMDIDTNHMFHTTVEGESSTQGGGTSVLVNTSMISSPKPADFHKRPSDLTDFRKVNQNSPWGQNDYSNDSTNVFNISATHKPTDEHYQRMTPIGHKPGSSENKTPLVRYCRDKLRRAPSLTSRARQHSKSTPSFGISDGCGEVNKSKFNQDTSSIATSSNSPECPRLKHDSSNFDNIYNSCNDTRITRSVTAGNVKLPSQRDVKQASAVFPGTRLFSAAGSFCSSEEGVGFQKTRALEDGYSRVDHLCTDLVEHSPSLKRRHDPLRGSDWDDAGANHCKAKRRMIEPLFKHLEEDASHDSFAEPKAPMPSPTVSSQAVIDLSFMSSWSVDQQRQILAVHVRAHVTEVLESASRPLSHAWSHGLHQMMKSLADKEWTVTTLADRLTAMLMEMEVAEIMNILQSRECLMYLTSEGLKQLDVFSPCSGGTTNTSSDNPQPTAISGNSFSASKFENLQFKNKPLGSD